jgi:hypothetical protein
VTLHKRKKNVNCDQTGHPLENKSRTGFKIDISLLVLIASWILWFVLDRGWIIAIGLTVASELTAEYLGEGIFTHNSWFERLSVEHAGFSVWRILAGVMVGVLILSLIILGLS